MKQPIWDLPVRLFHWTLVGLIALSWWSAEEHLYDVHLYSGLAIFTLIVFRVLWGLFGSSTARFSGFVRGPGAIRDYLQGKWHGIGHNPLGALSVLALLLLVGWQAGLGLFASDEDGLLLGPLSGLISIDASEQVTELHEALFNILLFVIGVHVLAVLIYLLGKKKNLIGPMVTGKGEVDPAAPPMQRGKAWVAVACLIAAFAFTRWIIAGAPPFGG